MTTSSLQNTLAQDLFTRAEERCQLPDAYAGDVLPQEAWDYIKEAKDAYLIDVRTAPEWQFVGLPNLDNAAGTIVALSWKLYPTFETNQDFVPTLRKQIPIKDTPIFFLCRSGGRSLDAAIAMSQEGYSHCFNIIEGFEGDPDNSAHRNTIGGWRAANLPWSQS